MTRLWKQYVGLGLLVFAASAQAQQPPPQPDTMRPLAPGMRGMQGRAPRAGQRMTEERLQQLRLQVEERFGRMVQQELQLNEQQMDRVRQAMRAHEDRRRDLMRRETDLRRAMEAQLQPGVAANQDSLGRMLDAVSRINVERAQGDQQYLRDLQFLNAVQRTRLIMMQRRLEARVRAIRERQMAPGRQGPMGPGAGPMPPQPPIEDEDEDELALVIEP